jgi:tetratricopeptide (TPR) repeat protein
MKRINQLIAVIIFTSLSLVPGFCFGQSSKQSQELFDEANKIFRRALDLSKTDPERARALFDESLLRYETLLSRGQIVNGRLYYNLGNIHYMRGELGYAILNYRRAQRLIPADRLLLTNLKVSRAKVRTAIPLDSGSKVLDLLILWHEDIPRALRFRLLQAGLFALGLLGLLWHYKRLPGRHRRFMIWLPSLLVFFTAASLLAEEMNHKEHEGVVVAAVLGRKGPDHHAYQPSFDQELSAGVEFELLEQRDQWCLIGLRDGRQTWVPRSVIGVIGGVSSGG